MIFEERYKILLSACQDIRRHRERQAKPVMADQILAEVGMDVPSESLLSHMIAEALLLRVDRNLLMGKNIYLQRYDISQIDLFGLLPRAIPHVPQSYAIANQYLAQALRPLAAAALIDIGIGKGAQVVDLLRELAREPGRLRRLRVVALDPSAANLAEAAAVISGLQPELPFQVDVLSLRALIEQCDAAMLRAAAGDVEATVINAAYALHHTRHAASDTEARTAVLRRLAVLQPRVFTLVEPSANHDTDQLTRRVHSCWEHFGSVFDLIDRSTATPLEKFAIKEKFFGREVRDILGTSDALRCERHEPYESWLLRLTKAGLRPFPGVDLTVALPDYCSAIVREGLVRLCYRGVPLIAVFAYRSPEGIH
ncbi:MAG: GAI protein2C [Myxococcales bacterium]|nr:GAI protein2C [Myxococcales bacterium]